MRKALPQLDLLVQDDIALMVSEVCTNAILHGSGPFVVSVECDDQLLSVSVTDHGAGGVVLRPSQGLEPRGRGLRIVDQLASEWGTSTNASGETVVWFRRELVPDSVTERA